MNRPWQEVRIATLLTAACLGCGHASDLAEWRIHTDGSVAGVRDLHAEPRMRIDGYAADLVPIDWLGVGPDGTVALLQSQDHQVVFFDSSGSLAGRIGREGDGPGEFRTLVRGGWRSDTLWVSDPMLGRVTLLASTGTLVRTLPPVTAAHPLPADSGALPTFGFLFPYALYQGDSLLVTGQGRWGDPRAEALGGIPLLLISIDGGIRRIVTVLPAEGSITIPLPEGGVATAQVPFFPHALWAVSPDGAAIVQVATTLTGGQQRSLTITLRNPQGQTLAERHLPFDGVPIPGQVADSAVERRAERAQIPEQKRAYETDIRRLVPPVYPPAHALVVGNDHHIWIGLRAVERQRPWLMLDDRAQPAGVLTLPVNASIRAAAGDDVWVVERDSVDVESVIRYHLSRTP